jgi:hypothetical protein
MNAQRAVCVLVSGIAVILIARLYSLPPSDMPLTIAFVGLTNLPPTVPRSPICMVYLDGTFSNLSPASPLHWIAFGKNGAISNLPPASPSHVLFTVKNRTTRPLTFRWFGHEFSDSLPAGVALPKGPSRHRAHVGEAPQMPEEPDLQVCHGMAFNPPDALFLKGRTLKAGETALLILPRPPFDCVWRPLLIYDLPLAKPQLLLYTIKVRLRVREKWEIYHAPQGATYIEWVRGVWITNAALNKITGANAGSPGWLPIRTRWAARIAQFCRWAEA